MTQSQGALALNVSPASTFNFESHAVRIVMRDGNPWFVAADVCAALELGNPTMAMRALDEDEKALSSIEGLSRGNDQANIISESGMYTLVLRCRDAVKPGTVPHRFRKWVTAEVLPTIRKTGAYVSTEAPHDPLALLYQALESGRWLLSTEDGRLTLKPVSSDAYIIKDEQFAAVIGEPGIVSVRLLPGIIAAAAERLSHLGQFQAPANR